MTLSPRASKTHHGRPKKQSAQTSPQPAHDHRERLGVLFSKQASQTAEEGGSFRSHTPKGRQNNGGERPKLHLAHSLSILPLLSFEPSVERCWLRKAVRWAVRMEYADIQNAVLPPVLPKPTRTHIRPVTVIGTRSRVAKPFTTQRL